MIWKARDRAPSLCWRDTRKPVPAEGQGLAGNATIGPSGRLLLAVIAGLIPSVSSAVQPKAESPPNVVLILSDDQAWTDYGFMGHHHVQTPTLDRLANASVVFKRGYVPTALCRPSLMTLATGHYAHRHGVTGNSPSSKHAEPGSKLYTKRLATLVSRIEPLDTLPALLAERGYLCHQSGKWWEGSYSNGGFTHGMTRGFPNPGRYDGFCRTGDDGLKIGREGMKPVEQFVDLAIQKRRPFFLWYAPYMPHVPHTPPERLLAKYTDAGLTRSTAAYYAMCEWFDETCGQLIDYLDEKGVRDNTLIVYAADNGWIQNPKGGGHLTRSKASPYEGGVRTPIMFSWPDKLGPADRKEVVSSIDIMPTILAATGIRTPTGLPGLNLLPHLKNGTPVQREMIFGENFAHNIADLEDPEASLTFRWVIAGKWKLLLTYDGEVVRASKEWDSRTGTEPQLFDLLADPHEKHNLAESHPEVVARLAREIANWYPVTKRKTEETVIRPASVDSLIGTELVANGDCEKGEEGAFESWTSGSKPGVASPSAAPSVIDGDCSAKLAAGGGFLLQTISHHGIGNFVLELDLAVLDTASTAVRSFGVVTYSTEGIAISGSHNIDSIRVITTAANRHEIQVFDDGKFQNTGLFVRPTPDLRGDLRLDDGEIPVVNHLKIVGTGYGTGSQTVTITLTGGQKSGTYSRRLSYVGTNAAVKRIGFYSGGSAADYLVDSLSFKPRPAPPPAPNQSEKALELMGDAEEIVFAVRGLYGDGHYYANFGHWSDDPNKMMYAEGGSRLCKLNLRTRQVTVLLDDPEGGVRDPRVHYDGGKILFSYRKGGTNYHHLYEINPDGTGLKQLTSGPWDDLEPTYLPDGGITFVSSRCNRFVPCYHTQVGLLYRMDADGDNIRLLSANNVDDHRPAVLPDGRVIYTRWDYVDRAPQKFHSLWAMNPDGTDQMVLFGNTVSPSGNFFVMIDALPIPGSDKIATVFSPGHGFRENAGHVMVLDPNDGPDDWNAAKQISPERNLGVSGWARGEEGFRDPYPLSEDCFLVVEDKSLCILNSQGTLQEIYRAEQMIHDPRVIRPRPRERVSRSRTDPSKSTGRFVLANVYQGRNMRGVKPGEIKKLLILEDLPKPVSYYSLPGAISMDGTHTLHRILGTVPVEPDGSASFEVPPLRGLFFVALDEKGLAVKRMQSYTMAMPGETQGCVGCHEPRTAPPSPFGDGDLMALRRPPSLIEPVAGVPDVIDYPRDVQPIWDKHCIECHSAEKPEGRVVLTGDFNEWFTQSYYALFASDQISDTRRYDEDGNHPPRSFGTAASPLMKKIDGSHFETKLTTQERDLVRLWVESGATFAGTYAAFNRTDSAVAGALCNTTKVAIGDPVGPIVKRRCLSCHGSVAELGQRVDKIRVNPLYTTSAGNPWRGRVNLPKHCWNLYNLSRPEKSMILLAPLAEEAGGYGWCQAKDGQPASVFSSHQDPDYQALLQAVRAAKARQREVGRFDMPGFLPNEHYVRWMKRFGILPENFDPAKDSIDPYETDRAYWRSLWHQSQTLPSFRQRVATNGSRPFRSER
jgi:arylsulfatase A-like enzyme